MTALPAVLPVISMACRIGTPAVVSELRVRDQRAMATFCTTSPIFIGKRSLSASQRGRPHLERLSLTNPTTRADEHDEHQVPLAGDQVREVDHELGQRRHLAREGLEHALEDRDQEGHQGQQHDHREADDHRRVDHGRADLAAQRRVLLELVGDAVEALLEHTAGLTGADHGHVELTEHLGVASQRVGEEQAGLDVLAHQHDRLAQQLGLGLVLEHVQRAQDRHARGDHRGQLARGHGQVLGARRAAGALSVSSLERYFWAMSMTTRPRSLSCSATACLDSASTSPLAASRRSGPAP